MRRFLLSLIALCFLAIPAAEGFDRPLVEVLTSPAELGKLDKVAIGSFSGTGGELTGFWQTKSAEGAAEPVQASITFLQCANDTGNLSTFTFNTQNTGTASADRVTLVGISTEDSAAGFSISSVTVGGDATTLTGLTGVTPVTMSAFAYLSNTAGTSETVVVTTSVAMTSLSICLWQVNDVSLDFGFFAGVDNKQSGNNPSLSLKIPARGVAAGMSVNPATQSATWTTLTEVADASNGEHDYSAADFTNDDSEDVATITVDWTGTDTVWASAIAFYPSDRGQEHIQHVGCYSSTTAATTYNFTNVYLGTEDAGRHTLFVVSAHDGAVTFGISSSSVGGDSATEVVDNGGSSTVTNSSIHIVANATGLLETVSVTATEAIVAMTICVYAVYDLDSATADDTATGSSTSGAAINLNVDTATDGFVVAVCANQSWTFDTAWTGINADAAWIHGTTSHGETAAASIDVVTGQTPRTVTGDSTTSVHSNCSSASW